MWDALSSTLVDLGKKVISFFPADPIQGAVSAAGVGPVGQWLGILNWFVPVGTILNILQLWLSAIAVYYIYQILLRWIKVIE